eukprot:Lankesteria_metandrocarpae@DN5300_c1_g1_i4.p3
MKLIVGLVTALLVAFSAEGSALTDNTVKSVVDNDRTKFFHQAAAGLLSEGKNLEELIMVAKKVFLHAIDNKVDEIQRKMNEMADCIEQKRQGCIPTIRGPFIWS